MFADGLFSVVIPLIPAIDIFLYSLYNVYQAMILGHFHISFVILCIEVEGAMRDVQP